MHTYIILSTSERVDGIIQTNKPKKQVSYRENGEHQIWGWESGGGGKEGRGREGSRAGFELGEIAESGPTDDTNFGDERTGDERSGDERTGDERTGDERT